MHLTYYRVFLQSLSTALLPQCCFQFLSTVLWYRVLMSLTVNKWHLQLNPSVFCLCLCFEFNPTPKLHTDSSIPNVAYFGSQCGAQSQNRDKRYELTVHYIRIQYELTASLLMEHQVVYQGTQSHVTSHPVGQKHGRWYYLWMPGQLKLSDCSFRL